MARGRPRKAGKLRNSGSKSRKIDPISALEVRVSGSTEEFVEAVSGGASDCDGGAEEISDGVNASKTPVSTSSKGKKERKKGPSSSKGKKMKSIEEVTGVRPIQFSDVSEDEFPEKIGAIT